MKYTVATIISLFTTPLVAAERETLVSSLVAAGTHETSEERHTVEVNDCQLTTYRWRNTETDGWVLWTSLVFGMADAAFDVGKAGGDKLYLELKFGTAEEPREVSIIAFKMADGIQARHEKSVLRKRRPGMEDSPRGDGSSHFYHMQDNFFILHEGPGVHAKAQTFTQNYKAYVERYCTFIG